MSLFFPDPHKQIAAKSPDQRSLAEQMFLNLTRITHDLAPEVKTELHALRHEGSCLLMPQTVSASDLFVSFAPRLDLNPAKVHEWPHAEFCIINPKPKEERDNWDSPGWHWDISCSIVIEGAGRKPEHYDVKPTDALLMAIGFNMLPLDGDTINLSVVVWDNGTATLTAKYNRIIGYRTLCYFDAATLPPPMATA